LKSAGLASVTISTTAGAGKNEHNRPNIVVDRVTASREWHRFSHRVIKPAPGNRGKVITLIEVTANHKDYVFSAAEQRLMNVELRWISRTDGSFEQERPILYLNHDEKVFWAHDGITREWRFVNPSLEVGIPSKLRGKGFGSSVMVAMFISVLGIFFWEVRRYGSKNGYWNGPCMHRHVAQAFDVAAAKYRAVRARSCMPRLYLHICTCTHTTHSLSPHALTKFRSRSWAGWIAALATSTTSSPARTLTT
jgi:hypothetical protein